MSTRKVDPYVYVMEWIFRHSKAKGALQHVLLRIGRAMRWTPSGFETGPLPTREIAEIGYGDSTIRSYIQRLGGPEGELEVFKSGRRGETYRYRLRRERLLPLEDLEPSLHRRMAAVTPPAFGGDPPPDFSGDTAELQRCDRQTSAVTPPDFSGNPVRTASSEVVRTENHNDHSALASFRAWFLAEWPKYHSGVPFRVNNRTSFDAAVRELLTGRTLERVQAMTLEMFGWPKGDWIGDSNHSVFVLLEKCSDIELRIVSKLRPARQAPCLYRHEPPCGSTSACVEKERLLVADRDEATG